MSVIRGLAAALGRWLARQLMTNLRHWLRDFVAAQYVQLSRLDLALQRWMDKTVATMRAIKNAARTGAGYVAGSVRPRPLGSGCNWGPRFEPSVNSKRVSLRRLDVDQRYTDPSRYRARWLRLYTPAPQQA